MTYIKSIQIYKFRLRHILDTIVGGWLIGVYCIFGKFHLAINLGSEGFLFTVKYRTTRIQTTCIIQKVPNYTICFWLFKKYLQIWF
jgi:hypothetical protein